MQFIIKKVSPYTLSIVFILVLVIVPVQHKFSQLNAQVDNLCEQWLNDADAEYNSGNWSESIDLINQCLNQSNITKGDKEKAYRLQGLVYIAIELEKEANDAVKNLLIMVPNYEIDPDRDPPQLKIIIDDVSQTLKPIISSITPNKTTVEDPGFTITVNGSDFVYGSVVQFNKTERVTTYISPTQLTAEILATDLLSEGEYDVTVLSPILGGKESKAEKFTVESPSNILTWLLIGGGAAVAAVVAILVLSGGEDDPGEFPKPPGRPSGESGSL